MRLITAALLGFAAASCASGMSKKECLYADWRAIGYEDGAAGRDASALAARRAACADKAQLAPDWEAYRAGREAGLEEFCRPANGFDFGARGGRYSGACEGRREQPFVAAYQQGLTLYGLTEKYEAASRALANAHVDLDGIDHRIAQAEAALVSPATPHAERLDHLAALKSLHQRRDKVRAAIDDLARDVDRAEADLADYRREAGDRS
jgi:hypothetical protein